MISAKRLSKEYTQILKNPLENCTLTPSENNIHIWYCTLIGPSDTPYENGRFELSISFTREYPHTPPNIYFKTCIYHPNISQAGGICLDILKDKWSPILTISKVMLSISSLLSDPNPDDPLVPEIAREMKSNIDIFYEKARGHTRIFASMGSDPSNKI
jgi:ubiquitin-conjugating enzyme E2 D